MGAVDWGLAERVAVRAAGREPFADSYHYGSLAADWEHTIAVTPAGVWVLTAEDGGESELAARGVKFGPLGD